MSIVGGGIKDKTPKLQIMAVGNPNNSNVLRSKQYEHKNISYRTRACKSG
jgi:hypothetical protein